MKMFQKVKSTIRNNLIISILLLIIFVLFVVPLLILCFKVILPIIDDLTNASSGFDNMKSLIDSPNLQETLKQFVVDPNSINQTQINEIQKIIEQFNNFSPSTDNINTLIKDLSEKISSLGVLSNKGQDFVNSIKQANDSLVQISGISKEWLNIDINQFASDINQGDDNFNKFITQFVNSKAFSLLILSIVSIFLNFIFSIVMFVRGIMFAVKNSKNDRDMKVSTVLVVFNILLIFISPALVWITWLITFISYKKKLKVKQELVNKPETSEIN